MKGETGRTNEIKYFFLFSCIGVYFYIKVNEKLARTYHLPNVSTELSSLFRRFTTYFIS